MEGWIVFWKVVVYVSTVAYYVMALFIVPAAFRDVLDLTRRLGNRGEESPPAPEQ